MMRADALAEVAGRFFKFQNAMKVHHWQTPLFARHKASDELLEKMSDLVDQFMESLQGAQGTRLSFGGREVMVPLNDVDDQEASEMVRRMREWLITDLPRVVPLDSGLANIRDEIVSALDTVAYLFTFRPMAEVVTAFSMSMLSKRNLPKFEHPCEHCSRVGSRAKKCGGCKLVYYCSVECQTAAWQAHKTECAVSARHPDLEATRKMRTQFKKLVLSQYATCKQLARGMPGVFVMALSHDNSRGIVFEFFSRSELAEKKGRGWNKAIAALDMHDPIQCVIGALADPQGNFIGSVTVSPQR